jgi:DNA-binding LytR/AlgR family response regulator
MRIAICDDYMEHARDIQDKIAVINEEIETDLYDDIEQLFSEVRVDKRKYDAIFMDMEWENNTRSGVDYVQMLSDMDCRARIVCVTAYTMKYIEKLFWNNVDIFGVINKPVNIESIEKILDKIQKSTEKSKEELVLSYNDTMFRVTISEIVYVKSEAHKTIIYMLDGVQSFYVPFKNICAQMPTNFYCINKGLLVNLDYVKRIEKSDVVVSYMKQIITLPVARDKRKDFKNRLFEYFG